MSIFISRVIFLFVYYFVKVFCRYYNLLAGQKIKFCTLNFICIFINVLLFTLMQEGEFITSTLNISQNMKNTLEGGTLGLCTRAADTLGSARSIMTRILLPFLRSLARSSPTKVINSLIFDVFLRLLTEM